MIEVSKRLSPDSSCRRKCKVIQEQKGNIVGKANLYQPGKIYELLLSRIFEYPRRIHEHIITLFSIAKEK